MKAPLTPQMTAEAKSPLTSSGVSPENMLMAVASMHQQGQLSAPPSGPNPQGGLKRKGLRVIK